MHILAASRCLFYRSLLGCGFLLLNWPESAWAQREVELQLSGGASLTQLAIHQQNLPDNFKVPGGFSTAATLRLTVPISQRMGLGLEQRVTSLDHRVAYDLGYSRQSTSLSYNTLHQSGISVRLYDVVSIGPQWGLDLAATGSYGWGAGVRETPSESMLFGSSSSLITPTLAEPLVVVRETNRSGTPMLGLELLLRYEWGLRNSLLLTAGYQRGLRQVVAIRSTRLEYLDAAGRVQQGDLTLTSRGAYATLQLGYGLRLGALKGSKPHSSQTPRYSIQPAEKLPDEPATEDGN